MKTNLVIGQKSLLGGQEGLEGGRALAIVSESLNVIKVRSQRPSSVCLQKETEQLSLKA